MNTPGRTLGEARENLQEAAQLVLGTNRGLAREASEGKDVIREPWGHFLQDHRAPLTWRISTVPRAK